VVVNDLGAKLPSRVINRVHEAAVRPMTTVVVEDKMTTVVIEEKITTVVAYDNVEK
jgi:hypothetical protein